MKYGGKEVEPKDSPMMQKASAQIHVKKKIKDLLTRQKARVVQGKKI